MFKGKDTQSVGKKAPGEHAENKMGIVNTSGEVEELAGQVLWC